jgi:hypothetical protein
MSNRSILVSEREAIAEIVSRHRLGRIDLVEAIRSWSFLADQQQEIRSALGVELMRIGIGQDDQPTEQGKLIEHWIDVIGRA